MVQMVEFLVEVMIQRVSFGRHVVDSASSNRVRGKNVFRARATQRESTVIRTHLSPLCRNRHINDSGGPKMCRGEKEEGTEKTEKEGER